MEKIISKTWLEAAAERQMVRTYSACIYGMDKDSAMWGKGTCRSGGLCAAQEPAGTPDARMDPGTKELGYETHLVGRSYQSTPAVKSEIRGEQGSG